MLASMCPLPMLLAVTDDSVGAGNGGLLEVRPIPTRLGATSREEIHNLTRCQRSWDVHVGKGKAQSTRLLWLGCQKGAVMFQCLRVAREAVRQRWTNDRRGDC